MSATIASVWFTSRAAGITALALASLSLTLGLLMARRGAGQKIGRIEMKALHEAVAIAALAMIALHGVALLLDPVLRPGLAGILVPFAGPFRPLGTAAGQIAAYGTAALSLSYYARNRIGQARWRAAHKLIPIFWALGLVHALTVGTDSTTPWFVAAVALPPLAAAALLAASGGTRERPPLESRLPRA